MWFAVSGQEKLKYPNGPSPWPFLGNIWTVHKLNVKPSQTCRKLQNDYGDMVTVWLGSQAVIFINSPQVAHDLLHKVCCFPLRIITTLHVAEVLSIQESTLTSSRPMHNGFRLSSLPDRLVVAPMGDKFNTLRKIYHTILQKRQVTAFRKHQEEETILLLDRLLSDPLTFRFECERFAVNVIFRTIYNSRLGVAENKLVITLYHVWETMYLCEASISLYMK